MFKIDTVVSKKENGEEKKIEKEMHQREMRQRTAPKTNGSKQIYFPLVLCVETSWTSFIGETDNERG